MFHAAIHRSAAPQPQPVDPDPCALLAARRAIYLKYLRRHTADPDTAEDLLQDFSLKVIRVVRRGAALRNTDAWMARVLRNTLFDHYRRRDARRRADAAYAGYLDALAGPGGVSEQDRDDPCSNPAQPDVEAALAAMRPDQADLLRALYLRGQSRDSLARQMNLSVGTLNVRVLRARRALLLAAAGRAADPAAPPRAAPGRHAGAQPRTARSGRRQPGLPQAGSAPSFQAPPARQGTPE